MESPPSGRSVKIDQDERGGWSSDRPRPDGATRPPNIATRCRVLTPTETLRYSPGSLLLVVSPAPEQRDEFLARLTEERSALLSMGKVRELLAGRVDADDLEARAGELLAAAVAKRLEANETVVVPAEGLGAEERERFARLAASFKRPCHILLVEFGRDQVGEADRPALNKLRSALDAGALGEEGFSTALRLGGGSIAELKRIVFRPVDRDD